MSSLHLWVPRPYALEPSSIVKKLAAAKERRKGAMPIDSVSSGRYLLDAQPVLEAAGIEFIGGSGQKNRS